LLRLFYSSAAGRLDHEAGVEYCSSWGFRTEIWSMRKSATAAPYCLLGLVKRGVGVTRKQVPTRWIDQGAIEASIVEVPNRYLAGITEVALKNYYADKTNWRKC
jgi:hypothetical protein